MAFNSRRTTLAGCATCSVPLLADALRKFHSFDQSAMTKRIVALVLAFLCALAAPSSADEVGPFLTRRGDQLMDGDRPFRFISFNVPNLMVIEDAYEFTRPNPWRWPDEFEIEDTLESIRQMGGQVVRTYVLSVHRDGSDMGDYVHVRR